MTPCGAQRYTYAIQTRRRFAQTDLSRPTCIPGVYLHCTYSYCTGYSVRLGHISSVVIWVCLVHVASRPFPLLASFLGSRFGVVTEAAQFRLMPRVARRCSILHGGGGGCRHTSLDELI